ncbi:hypothetical protein NDU88_006566 [Pleurodeles waltl]|uniref:Uncharacterized protein n=1 Tax=Pleurodeles waltl TaxID=8319 RepID=A0AAV7VRX9_PLEWA|nr:hypothetical protein NDU88_006566 [Pleurodeles waltl]
MGRLRSAVFLKPPASEKTPTIIQDTQLLDATPQLSTSDNLDKVLATFEHSRASLENKLGSLVTEMSFLHNDHHKLAENVLYGEKTLATLQPLANDNQGAIRELQNRIQHLEDRVEHAECLSMRSNVRILGLPEGVEGQDPMSFLESWFKTFTSPSGLTTFLAFERAHLILACCPLPGAERPMLAELLRFRDENTLL